MRLPGHPGVAERLAVEAAARPIRKATRCHLQESADGHTRVRNGRRDVTRIRVEPDAMPQRLRKMGKLRSISLHVVSPPVPIERSRLTPIEMLPFLLSQRPRGSQTIPNSP